MYYCIYIIHVTRLWAGDPASPIDLSSIRLVEWSVYLELQGAHTHTHTHVHINTIDTINYMDMKRLRVRMFGLG